MHIPAHRPFSQRNQNRRSLKWTKETDINIRCNCNHVYLWSDWPKCHFRCSFCTTTAVQKCILLITAQYCLIILIEFIRLKVRIWQRRCIHIIRLGKIALKEVKNNLRKQFWGAYSISLLNGKVTFCHSCELSNTQNMKNIKSIESQWSTTGQINPSSSTKTQSGKYFLLTKPQKILRYNFLCQ